LIIMASASGTPVPAIARLVAAYEDTVRDVSTGIGAWPASPEQGRLIRSCHISPSYSV